MVKRFLQLRGGKAPGGSRYAPEMAREDPAFEIVTRKAVGPDKDELDANPRARSAKLRVARRTDAPPAAVDRRAIGMPLPRERN